MKRSLVFLMILMVLTSVVYAQAENASGNATNGTDIVEKLKSAGDDTTNQIASFLADASPFLLIAIGVILVLLSGMAKWIGLILIILAVIRLGMILLS
jgi:hypothetical protein